jgi:hypothetical protein
MGILRLFKLFQKPMPGKPGRTVTKKPSPGSEGFLYE